ncbi:MAG: 1-deoxy-D-xylulose-5-phosphate reductoisomerase [Candidatus Aminicenantes bacterium]|nr:1-deoxy-D-xylulose-5-phosphate reductoisomerase [Candidatus Aminicenantes bacterium]
MKKSKKRIVILGSTGSIGQNTLEIVRLFPDKFEVVGLSAGKNTGLLAEQIEEFQPVLVAVETEADAQKLRKRFSKSPVKVLSGETGLREVASLSRADLVVSAITGIAGLRPTLAALEKGKDVALANKESMVVAGDFLRKIAARTGARIIPVDSEHSGVFQCLNGQKKKFLRRVYLTASGGPFLKVPIKDLPNKSCGEALQHPRWKMGKKVSIDSATLMNKGLELIEARWLFDLKPDQLDVLIHPQSIVHALVEFKDGSVLAQLSQTDMKIPILYALTYPDRLESPLPSLDLTAVKNLEFYPVEKERYPLFALARRALETGLSFPVVLNAANEVAVEAFLEEKISFGQIYSVVDYCLQSHRAVSINSLEDIFVIDQETRNKARQYLRLKGKQK